REGHVGLASERLHLDVDLAVPSARGDRTGGSEDIHATISGVRSHGARSPLDLELAVTRRYVHLTGGHRDANVAVAGANLEIVAGFLDRHVAVAGRRAKSHALRQQHGETRRRRAVIPIPTAPTVVVARVAAAPHTAARD